MEIIGNHNKAIVYTETIESGAEGLIRALCNYEEFKDSNIRIMPDVHPGKGCAIGTTMTYTDKLAPGLVGVDIGCGITAVKFKPKKFELDKLDKFIRKEIPSGRGGIRPVSGKGSYSPDRVFEYLKFRQKFNLNKAARSFGTLGGGNHFIEVDKDEEGYYWLVVHTGSRGLGVEIEKYYHELAWEKTKDTGVPYEFAYLSDSKDVSDYATDVGYATRFAAHNRLEIIDLIMRHMKTSYIDCINCPHNYIDSIFHIVRKGAIEALENQKVIIPINMRDGCILGVGKGNKEWNHSAPHGAGRLYSRSEVSQHFTVSQFKKEMKGIYTSCIGSDTLDESPMAYKPINSIIKAIEPAVEVREIIKPIYNFKAGGK